MPPSPDALVIGAGPAGLMAAEELAKAGVQTVVVEAKPTVARKFLMAGKSGLNITKDEDLATFINQYDAANWLAPMLQAFGPLGLVFLEGQLQAFELAFQIFHHPLDALLANSERGCPTGCRRRLLRRSESKAQAANGGKCPAGGKHRHSNLNRFA